MELVWNEQRGCVVECAATLVCASQVCGYSGTDASHHRKVPGLTLVALDWTVYNLGPVASALRAASILVLQTSKLLV